MTREYLDDDALRSRKKAILARINRKYNNSSGSNSSLNKYTKLHPIESMESGQDSESIQSSSHVSFLPHNAGGDSREDYIKKLKQRIKQLEESPIERMGSSRFDFESDGQESPATSRKHRNHLQSAKGRVKTSDKIPHDKNLKPLPQPQQNSAKSKQAPPKSPPISASGSYDLSKYKLLDPIPSSASKSSKSSKSIKSSFSSKNSIIPESDPTMRLEPCEICLRKFRVERLEKHREACEKAHKKKRPVFDEQKMRIKGTELETFKQTSSGGYASDSESKAKKGARKGNTKAKIKVSKVPPNYAHPIDDDLIACTHCGRKFSESSIEKHEGICSKLQSKPKRDVFRVRPI